MFGLDLSRPQLGDALRPWRLRGRVLLVGDGAGWILDRVARELTANLPDEVRALGVTRSWQRARHCAIHFLSRVWAWSDGVATTFHPSNRLIAVWWHGRLDSPDPAMQAALRRMRALHDRFARIQVTCSIARDTMLALGVPPERIVVLPEGVDLLRFRPPRTFAERQDARQRLRIPDGAIAVGCFNKDGGGWADGMEPKWVKAPDVLAEVLSKLAARHSIHAVVPGPARGYLTRRLQEAGVPFTAPGFVPDDELPLYHRALDIYLSPARDEGGPAALLESMATGVPVVSTRAGMAADMIRTGVDGFVVDVDDADGLVDCADELIRRPDLRRCLAAAGLATIRDYDWPAVALRYANTLYRPLLQERRH